MNLVAFRRDFEHGYHLAFLGDADFGHQGFDGAFAFAGGSYGDGVVQVGT
ncbi:hypothetical protein AB0M54_15880 [Actinoplanes sp. NPDC051470]